MTCDNCTPRPGKIIMTTSDAMKCADCGRPLKEAIDCNTQSRSNWDPYFRNICEAVASKSPCLSRKIGAILVKDNSILSTGYNGPPRGVPHCGRARILKDDELMNHARKKDKVDLIADPREFDTDCPRKVLGYKSGTHMELCPAQHAEENAISNAARNGTNIKGSTLYMNCIIPCQKCFGTLINAGIIEIVVDSTEVYDKHTQFLIDNSNIKIRKFDL